MDTADSDNRLVRVDNPNLAQTLCESYESKYEFYLISVEILITGITSSNSKREINEAVAMRSTFFIGSDVMSKDLLLYSFICRC